jgi:hypothetical protein
MLGEQQSFVSVCDGVWELYAAASIFRGGILAVVDVLFGLKRGDVK